MRYLNAPSTGATAVRAVAVRRQYGNGAAVVTALDNVSVAVPRGCFIAVVGPSGSGKSTLLHCLAGLDTPDSGKVYLGETELTRLSEHDLTSLRRDRVGFVFQSFNVVPVLTAGENILLPLRLAGRTPDREWIDRVIDTVGLRNRLGHRPSQLSGGQQQRVAVARALVTRPEVVFADEPTGNLDSRASAELMQFLRRSVGELAQTVVMVTHNPAMAAYADRTLVLCDGRVVDDLRSPTAELVQDRVHALGARP
jgi:putative ABC transport system ATP-binding protein